MSSSTTDQTEVTPAKVRGLRRYNVIAGVVHAAQAVAVILLANSFSIPVTGTYLTGPPGSPGEPVAIFDVRVGLAVAAFLALSAVFHLLVSAPGAFERYSAGLKRKINVFRWVEYSLSSSLMIVLIALIVGITDIAALLALAGVNASMILFGWLQEKYHQPGDGGWLPFVFGSIAGAIPWVAIVVYVIAPGSTSGAQPPTFVYAIIISLFIFFNIFAINQFLQYKPVERFRNYLVGERAYITLSLVAKSLLAWQVFAGTLAG